MVNMAMAEYTPATIVTWLNGLRREAKYCDVNLVVQGKRHPAHRAVLATFSPVFEVAFSGRFIEGHTLPCNVCLEEIGVQAIEPILEYAYTAKAQLTPENVAVVLRAANCLQAVALMNECWAFLNKDLKAENCVGVYHLGKFFSNSPIRDAAENIVMTQFPKVAKQREFLEADSDFVSHIVKSESLAVDDEDVVFSAVIRWVLHDEDDRAQKLPQMLKHVRLAYVSTALLFDTYNDVALFRNNPTCVNLMLQAHQYRLLPSRRMDYFGSLCKKRRMDCQVQALCLERVLDNDKVCVTADGQILQVPAQCTAPDWQDGYLAVRNHESIFVTFKDCNVWRYSSETDSYHLIQENFPNGTFGVALVDYCWFLIGGYERRGTKRYVSSEVRMYHIQDRTWKVVEPLPQPTAASVAVTVGGRIYVLGGLNSLEEYCSLLQCYDPRTRNWTLLKSLPLKPKNRVYGCALNGHIYVMSCQSRSVHVYDVSRDAWRRTFRLQHQCVSGPVIWNEKIVTLTCNKANERERFLETYFPASDSWQIFAQFTDFVPRWIHSPVLTNPVRNGRYQEGSVILFL